MMVTSLTFGPRPLYSELSARLCAFFTALHLWTEASQAGFGVWGPLSAGNLRRYNGYRPLANTTMDNNPSDSSRYTLCRIDELGENESREFHISPNDPHSVFVIRRGSRVYAYRNRCPHTGAPLNWQGDNFLSLDRSLIQCSLHGAQFRIEDGVCVWGPCIRQRLAALRVVIEHGSIVLLSDRDTSERV